MNLKDWPVADMAEFEEVIIDATKWGTDGYSANLNFVHKWDEEGNLGFTLCSGLVDETLRGLYMKIKTLVELGLFDGSEVQAHGNLYDEDHNELALICWHQFDDDEWDEGRDDNQALTMFDEGDPVTLTHRAPSLLQ